MSIKCYREILERADSEEIRQGRAWYWNANQRIEKMSAETGYPLKICAGVVAVLSPMVEWGLNFRTAEKFLNTKGKTKGPGFKENFRKAREILRGNMDVIRGPKVSRFFQTLVNPNFDEPTIDSQMIAAFWSDKPYSEEIGKRNREKYLRPMREAVIQLANERKESVSQTQAIIWLSFKRLNGQYADQLKLWK